MAARIAAAAGKYLNNGVKDSDTKRSETPATTVPAKRANAKVSHSRNFIRRMRRRRRSAVVKSLNRTVVFCKMKSM